MYNYSLIEKLAIVKTLDEIIIANGEIAPGEEKMLKEIMERMQFNSNFVDEARKLLFTESLDILKRMPLKRKKEFAELMYEIAISDGYIDEKETNLIINIYKEADIDIESPGLSGTDIDLTFIFFDAKGYYEYPEGISGSRNYIDEPKLIKMEPLINTNDRYSLMIFDALQDKSIWGKEIIFKPIEMQLVQNADGEVKFQSEAFQHTEVVLYHYGPEINKIGLNTKSPFKYREYIS